MNKEEISLKNNRFVNYLTLNIIFSGIFILMWFADVILNLKYNGMFFLEGGILFFVISLIFYIKIRKIRKIILTE